jgi:hypothetical protein
VLTLFSGVINIQTTGLNFRDVKAVGTNEELVELDGNIPFGEQEEMKLTLSMRDFDFGSLIPEREGPPLTNTNAIVEITGTMDDLFLTARLNERDMNLFGNMAFTCDSACVELCETGAMDPDDAPPGEIVLTGKISLGPDSDNNDGGFAFGDIELTDANVSGAICIGPHPAGLPTPSEYKHFLGEGRAPENKSTNGGVKIGGVLVLDGELEGKLSELRGDIYLSASTLKLGLQEISDFRMGLAAAGPSSYAVEGRWDYPSGGSISLSGPAGWDTELRTGFVALDLDVKSAPINEVLALAGLDVSKFATGAFDGGGRITGPIGDLAFSEFRMDVSQGSRLLGMILDKGTIEFGLSEGILELTHFEILSSERTIGGRCSITGSGEMYLQETGVLPQAHLTAKVVDYRLEDLRTVFDITTPFGGRLDTDISYDEQERKWNIDSVSLSDLKFGEKRLPELDAALVFNPLAGRLEVNKLRINDGASGWMEASGYATLGTLTALFNPERRSDLRFQRVDFSITGEDFDLGFLAGLLPEQIKIPGKLDSIDLHIKGKPALPTINGTINPNLGPISFGDFLLADEFSTHSGTGLVWKNGVLELGGDVFIRRGEAIANLVGNLDLRPLNPLVRYEKRYEAPENNYILLAMNSDTPLLLSGTGFSFNVFPEELTLGISSGEKEVDGKLISSGELDIKGTLNVSNGYLDATQVKLPEGGAGGIAPVNYDLIVRLGTGVRLKAGGSFNATLESGEVNLSGTPLTPRLSGRVEVADGKINFASRTFTLQPGSEVSFNPLFGINPFLKAEAEIYISQHPKGETGSEPLIITAKIESFLTDLQRGIKFSSNYPYTNNELLAILGYQEVFLALEEEGFSGAFTSGLYLYPTELISRYVRDMTGFSRFDVTLLPEQSFKIDLETEVLFDDLLLSYSQTFGDGTNYIWGTKYRFRRRSYVGFKYFDLDLQDRHDWFYFVEYLLPLK